MLLGSIIVANADEQPTATYKGRRTKGAKPALRNRESEEEDGYPGSARAASRGTETGKRLATQ